MSPQQEVFCREFIKDFDVERAMKAVGLPVQAKDELFYDSRIEARVRALIQMRIKRLEIDGDMAVVELKKVAEAAVTAKDFGAAVAAWKQISVLNGTMESPTGGIGAAGSIMGGLHIHFGHDIVPHGQAAKSSPVIDVEAREREA